MPLSNLNKEKVFFVLKLAGAVLILYLWISYNVFDVWERLSDYLNKNYLEEQITSGIQDSIIDTWDTVNQYINEAIQELNNETWWHGAASVASENSYVLRFDKICKSNNSLCKKIEFEWDYTAQEKYLYLSAIFNVVNFIDDNMVIWDSVSSAVDTIVVDSSMWSQRWYVNWTRMVFNIWYVVSRSEFISLVAHEFGHILDLGSIKWTSSNKHWSFTEFGKKVFAIDDLSIDYYSMSWKSEKIRKSTATKKDFCSWYGMSDPFEDFAECFNLYVNHNSLFKAIAKNNVLLKKKYNFIANIIDGKYLSSNADELNYIKNNVSRRPWDTTRIGW